MVKHGRMQPPDRKTRLTITFFPLFELLASILISFELEKGRLPMPLASNPLDKAARQSSAYEYQNRATGNKTPSNGLLRNKTKDLLHRAAFARVSSSAYSHSFQHSPRKDATWLE